MRQFKFLLLLFLVKPSMAVIVKLSDLHTMAKKSDIVIHGFVGEQVTVFSEKRLITLTRIEIIDNLSGKKISGDVIKSGDVITVYQVGGEKDGLVMPILGGQKYT